MGNRSARRALGPVEGSVVRGHTAFAATRSTGGERAVLRMVDRAVCLPKGPSTDSTLRKQNLR